MKTFFVCGVFTKMKKMDKDTLFSAIKAALRAGFDILEIYNDPLSDFGKRKQTNHP